MENIVYLVIGLLCGYFVGVIHTTAKHVADMHNVYRELANLKAYIRKKEYDLEEDNG